jgi:D-aminopeptidase
MNCNGFKGGVGTSSRKLAASDGAYMLGVLVQCNTGSRAKARIAGYPVGREIVGYEPCVAQRMDPPQRDGLGRVMPVCTAEDGRHASTSAGTSDHLADAGAYGGTARKKEEPDQGSIIVVVATDAPITPDQLHRLVRRVELGLGRIGSNNANGSGDIFVAFSTANVGVDDGNSRVSGQTSGAPSKPSMVERLASYDMDPLFEATAEAVEEAVVNAMIGAETMTGADFQRRYAIPHDQVQAILRKHGLLVSTASGG